MEKAVISIIIPAYNIEKELPRTLNSVLTQSYPNLEIIVVNDGSQDGTADVINRYAAKHSQIKAVHKENGGVTSARLRGVAEARGEWIGFVDGDDILEPDMYEKLMANALAHQADISHCGYQMVFPHGHVDLYHGTGKKLIQNHDAALEELLQGNYVEPALWNKLFKKILFQPLLSSQLMDTSIKINEDVLMNYYLFKQSQCAVFEDICPYHYMLRAGSAANSQLNEHKLLDPLKVSRILYQDTEGRLHQIARQRLVIQLIRVATMPYGDQKNLIAPYKKNAKRELRALIPALLQDKACSRSTKIKALWSSLSPITYQWTHMLYSRITGLDKIYDLNK